VNVTFVGAHQDDEMFCLGTLLLYHQRGDRISLICATNGDKGISDDPDFSYAECARLRDLEMREVARALSADYTCLDEPDESLFDTYENRLKMIEAIRRSKPDVVFTHFKDDYNLDHTITSDLVFQGTLLSPIASVRTTSPALHKSPPIFYINPGPGFRFEATHFVEIDEATSMKALEIMGFHKTQMDVSKRFGNDFRDMIQQRWKAVGERVGVPFAEAFRPCLASRRTPLARLLP
jgi:LmbE family N-acetylglucosaminyl deacetylase